MVRLLTEKIALPAYDGYGVVVGPGVGNGPGAGYVPVVGNGPGVGVGIVVRNPVGGMVWPDPGIGVGIGIGNSAFGIDGLPPCLALRVSWGCFLRGGIATSTIMSKHNTPIMAAITIHSHVGNIAQKDASFTVKSLVVPFRSAM